MAASDSTRDKSERIVVRCDPDFKSEFHGFAATFDNHQAAIEALLDEWEREPKDRPTAATQGP